MGTEKQGKYVHSAFYRFQLVTPKIVSQLVQLCEFSAIKRESTIK